MKVVEKSTGWAFEAGRLQGMQFCHSELTEWECIC